MLQIMSATSMRLVPVRKTPLALRAAPEWTIPQRVLRFLRLRKQTSGLFLFLFRLSFFWRLVRRLSRSFLSGDRFLRSGARNLSGLACSSGCSLRCRSRGFRRARRDCRFAGGRLRCRGRLSRSCSCGHSAGSSRFRLPSALLGHVLACFWRSFFLAAPAPLRRRWWRWFRRRVWR